MSTFTQIIQLENYNKEYGIYKYNNMKIQIIKECSGNTKYDSHNIYNDLRVFNNRQPGWNHILHKFN
jgi:hypothetical protein